MLYRKSNGCRSDVAGGMSVSESLVAVDVDTVKCPDRRRIKDVIWLNLGVHAVPLGIHDPAW